MAERKVRVRMLRPTIVEGKVVLEGKTVEVSGADARLLINTGKAELVKESKREAAVVEPPEDAAAPKSKAKKKG